MSSRLGIKRLVPGIVKKTERWFTETETVWTYAQSVAYERDLDSDHPHPLIRIIIFS
jgi:hypothetical protein